MSKLRAARGRGNQGDWQKPIDTDRWGTDRAHLDHNVLVEAERQARQEGKRRARGVKNV
jgi:hypothetical protein